MVKFIKEYFVWLVLLSVACALFFGIYTPQIFKEIEFLGEIFINLLKAFAIPLIVSSIIVSLGNMGKNLNSLKSLSKNVVFYMVLSEVVAVTIAIVLFNLFTPGHSVDPSFILTEENSAPATLQTINIPKFLISIFPNNIVADIAAFNLMSVVIFAIIFGVATAIVKEKGEPVIKFMSSVRDIVNVCLNGVMLTAPLGIFALVGQGVAQAQQNGHLADNFLSLATFMTILIFGLFLHALWQFLLMVFLTKQSLEVLKKCVPLFSTAFATSSSVASLPLAMQTADELKSKPEVTRFMLPLCASINIGGMMLYEVAAVLFFAQVLGLDLSIQYQIILAVICILMGMAEGGIPETSLISFVMIFKLINIPLSAISILLPLDRILDRLRTVVNIFGNMCGVVIVSHFTSDTKTSEISLQELNNKVTIQEG